MPTAVHYQKQAISLFHDRALPNKNRQQQATNTNSVLFYIPFVSSTFLYFLLVVGLVGLA